MRALIVDDSKTMRKIERCVLEGLGYTDIEEAVDGQDALSRVAAVQPSLILLDWHMPNMDGITFLRAFRARDRLTPVVMVTVEADKARVLEAIRAGASNYVVKPFAPEGLAKIIEATVAKARAA